MKCGEVRERFGEYVAGALDPEERATVDRHVASCGACRSERAAFARLETALEELAPRRRGLGAWIGTAAAVLVVAVVITAVRPSPPPALADGCAVRDEPGAQWRVVAPRAVRLDEGAAFFEVRGPFAVATPRGRVEVLGTSFRVEVDMGRGAAVGAGAVIVTVAVVTGAVIFRQDGRDTTVRAGERIKAGPETVEKAAIPSAEELSRLERELADARARIAALEKENTELKAPKVDPPAPRIELSKLIEEFDGFAENALDHFQTAAVRDLIEKLKEAGPAAVEEMARRLLEGKTTGERFLAGWILEKIGDPAALPALAMSLKNEQDDLVRRMASHATARIGTKDALPALREAMSNDKDWGVRVNSAYGVAAQGQEDGIKLLAEHYASKDTPDPYRIAVLQAMTMVAHPSYAPTFRQVLASSKDITHLLFSIGGLEAIKDTGALPDLERVATGDYPATVREAAVKAIKKLRGE
jgi:hypothetical protein